MILEVTEETININAIPKNSNVKVIVISKVIQKQSLIVSVIPKNASIIQVIININVTPK